MSYNVPSAAKPFTLNISEKELSEFKQLLQLSRIGPLTWESSQEDRRFGVTHKWLIQAKDYWLNKYDWRAQEKHINSFPNYKMNIEDDVGGSVDVHFVGLFSEKKDAVPIVWMHGWPGSFIEFLSLLELVKEKYSSKDLPYHIVVPSLPGYTLSSGGPVDKDWGSFDSARVINQLMKNLGFNKYIAQGGDIGSGIARILAATSDSCIAVHLNLLSINKIPNKEGLSAFEVRSIERAEMWKARGMAYALEHGTRPATIGAVLNSNPLSLLAWIGEKFLEWTDDDPSLDKILTNVSLYWFTNGFPRSIYPYRVFIDPNKPPPAFIEKPFGFSMFPFELAPGLEKQAKESGNLVLYRQHDKGGHFAALECPKELLQDVEDFVKVAWVN